MNAFLEIPVLPPRTLVLDPPLSDEEFERMSAMCESASLERSKQGEIIVNAPASGGSSSSNAEITRQLSNWWIQHRQGRVFDSSGGFFLPDGSVLSPDAAFATSAQMKVVTREDLRHFLRLVPAFIVELRSATDKLSACHEKMGAWIANGIRLGWLIDPEARQVHVYEPGVTPCVESGATVEGTGPIHGFVLDLTEVWRCFE
jgi:Uma2 family endonuclease